MWQNVALENPFGWGGSGESCPVVIGVSVAECPNSLSITGGVGPSHLRGFRWIYCCWYKVQSSLHCSCKRLHQVWSKCVLSFPLQKQLKMFWCLLCEKVKLHFGKGLVLEKTPWVLEKTPRVSCAMSGNFTQGRECDKEAIPAHHAFFSALGLSCMQRCQSIRAVWWSQGQSEKLLVEAFVFLVSCAGPGNENDFDKPVKLWELFWFQLRKAFAQSMCNFQYFFYSNFTKLTGGSIELMKQKNEWSPLGYLKPRWCHSSSRIIIEWFAYLFKILCYRDHPLQNI